MQIERKFMHTMQTIRSFKYQLYIIKQNIKSPLALTMINDTCWMMGLALCHTAILVCCKYLANLLIIFSEVFVIYFNFLTEMKKPF